MIMVPERGDPIGGVVAFAQTVPLIPTLGMVVLTPTLPFTPTPTLGSPGIGDKGGNFGKVVLKMGGNLDTLEEGKLRGGRGGNVGKVIFGRGSGGDCGTLGNGGNEVIFEMLKTGSFMRGGMEGRGDKGGTVILGGTTSGKGGNV